MSNAALIKSVRLEPHPPPGKSIPVYTAVKSADTQSLSCVFAVLKILCAISGDVFFFFLSKLYVLLGHHSSVQLGVKLKVSLMSKGTVNKDK